MLNFEACKIMHFLAIDRRRWLAWGILSSPSAWMCYTWRFRPELKMFVLHITRIPSDTWVDETKSLLLPTYMYLLKYPIIWRTDGFRNDDRISSAVFRRLAYIKSHITRTDQPQVPFALPHIHNPSIAPRKSSKLLPSKLTSKRRPNPGYLPLQSSSSEKSKISLSTAFTSFTPFTISCFTAFPFAFTT